ncbi:hypothetical protein B0A81_18585 [Flavobacterium plurextorum]|uniref:Inclusion body protein n=1 Tax=Flavobacterium plurextorum TaxID=1114867 RepID=A0ABX4CR62_9FLAO|nr:hypothetical protein [Flavobacterium plurextorum]OXB03339.1 hypothetical protein B0A81_18585 [Flavobacterium plurextorum]
MKKKIKLEENDKLEELADYVVKATQHVVMLDPDTLMPGAPGSGCAIKYRERLFFISVRHVTDRIGLQTAIDKGTGTQNGTNVFVIPELNYIDTVELLEGTEEEDLNTITPLDICYAEIKEDFEIFQKEIVFNEKIRVEAGNKIIPFTNLDFKPTKGEKYSLYGRIRAATYNETHSNRQASIGH